MMITNTARVAAIYQQNQVRPASRVSRADEKRDLVALSDMAKDYSAIKMVLSRTPDVREDRVNAIKGAIEANSYNISADMIADKFLNSFA